MMSDDSQPEYRFDYTKAKPNRFAYVEQRVNYALEIDNILIIVENVPARVCVETGEKFLRLKL